MPSIRDISWAYETSTTDAGIIIPVPSNRTNDLLLLYAMSDTGAPTWTLPTGYTQSFSRNNTCATICAYKISNGNEPTSVTVGANVNETYNGAIIAIQDVNTTNPFGVPAVTTSVNQNSATAFKFSAPQLTCSVSNSLFIAFSANSTNAVPSFIEGQGHGILGADGQAESMGLGWFFMRNSGSITPAISCSNVAAGVGVLSLHQIAPPSSGATIVPVYAVSDTSEYLDPINGTTAYDGNVALAATADTNFTGSINGVAVSDATVAAATDTGINSFHSTGQLTSVTTINFSAAELVFTGSRKPNLTNSNVLCHVQSSTAGQLQRLSTIGSRRGILFGLRSGSANDFKIWQVLGSDSPNASSRYIPIIVHPLASNTLLTRGTFTGSNTAAVGMWVSSTGVGAATIWQFCQLWKMGTTIVCGGNVEFPVDISTTVDAISKYKERQSSILQGSKQMILLQDLQYGDGGTNPIYLNLDSTAIEFPSLYNTSSRQVSYNSIPNQIGITYHAGPLDTINHVNSIISSPSRYKWTIHPSSSVSASYNFDGLSIIGAGEININCPITISGITFNNFTYISASSIKLDSCEILNIPSSSNSLILNNSSSITNTSINVKGLPTGSFFCSVNSPSIFSNCAFVGTGSGGHAIRVINTGSFTFTGNTTTGFGNNNTSASFLFNNSGGPITMSIVGGDTITYRNGPGASTLVINNIAVTVTGLKDNTEVRVYLTGTETELAGTESALDGTTDDRFFTFSLTAGTIVDIVIISITYANIRIDEYTVPASDSSIPINQVIDRNYNNP